MVAEECSLRRVHEGLGWIAVLRCASGAARHDSRAVLVVGKAVRAAKCAEIFLRAAGIPVRPPAGWGRRSPAKPANEVITDSGAESVTITVPEPQPSRSGSPSLCEQYRELIELGLSRGRNAKAIWQDLVDGHGFSVGYQSAQRFVGKLRRAAEPEARAVIQTAPGEEAQVDYGSGPMVRDPQTGKYHRTRLFVLTLGYSRKCVRLLVFRSTVRVWAELHEKAFRRLGGATRVVVLDNLREGVLASDLYDPALNPLYKDLLQHYGAVALPCRVRDPDHKGKVESSVGHAKKTPLKALRFESLEEAQAYLDQWEARWADTRIHGTTKRQVAAMFAEERPALLPLPLEPFRYYQYGERTVHLDGCVEVEAAYYSTPPGWIGRRVHVRWNDSQVRLMDPRNGQLLREHLRQERGRHRIYDEDRRRKTPLSTERLLRRAELTGAHIGVLCQLMHRNQGRVAVRRILGVLALVKKYGVASTEDACAVALETGACEYRFVRRYLEHNPQLALSLRQIDPLIRQLTQYRDLIEKRTRQENDLCTL
ncbi:MAG TPA: IS21 family transposase [Bryobacteraceae bacterium]|nr:IS21 family transposase [Bryobacteraceae bacterium]